MELLTVRHDDFTMYVECSKFEGIWYKAVANVGEEHLTSTYAWTDGVKEVKCGDSVIGNGEKTRAVFFDNAEYLVWVQFESHVEKAQFGSILQSDNERFSFRRGVLAGFINYGNDIGKSELNLTYQLKSGETKRFTLSYDVLSTKLNYHEHWQRIVEDIEQEYRMLSLDYMRRTFHGFSPDEHGETPELIWWNVFAGERERFIRACKSIIERPRRRLRGYDTYQRADKIRRVTPSMENELAEHRTNEAHLYRIEEYTQSNDTQENRFLKYALAQIIDKYETLKSYIESNVKSSDNLKQEMDECLATMKHLHRNPFFRTVGRFKGLNQESLVLQKATGYSQVYRTWNLLRRAYSLQDGMYRLQTKDIATLYEIWCFIEVSHIVREQLGITRDDVDHRNRMEMNGVFTYELGKGEHSRILFRKDGVELAELVYNPKHTDRENDSISMQHLVVPTVPQKPDIVLQLTKDDMAKGMKMTYLFDAKYRIGGKEKGVDVPPEDAINQMHRYRDAIYYKENNDSQLKKEVIGGYILFPGDGEPLDVAKSKFYETIKDVNIGAFPLRPKDEHNRKLLEEFIRELIDSSGYEQIIDTIPQKGLHYTDEKPKGKMVYVGHVHSSNPMHELFKRNESTMYYTGGYDTPHTLDLQAVKYLMPIVGGKIGGVYEVISVNSARKSDKKVHNDNPDDGVRFFFNLGKFIPFGDIAVSCNNRLHNAEVMTLDEAKETYRRFAEWG